LARALIAEPELLLLDEPAAGLGADEVEELAAVTRELPRRGTADGASGNGGPVGDDALVSDMAGLGAGSGACAVMLVEHHVDLVMRVCDEVVVLDFGRVIASGDPATVRASAAVTKAYLGTGGDAAEPDALQVDVAALDVTPDADAAARAVAASDTEEGR
ncbi:MAG TPA: hypothetical protein VH442_02030, partial [Micromonosporaceae bacterium]